MALRNNEVTPLVKGDTATCQAAYCNHPSQHGVNLSRFVGAALYMAFCDGCVELLKGMSDQGIVEFIKTAAQFKRPRKEWWEA